MFLRKRIVLDDESAKINEQANTLNNDEVENASEVVSDTYFGDNGEVQGFEHQHDESNAKEISSDPFTYYSVIEEHFKDYDSSYRPSVPSREFMRTVLRVGVVELIRISLGEHRDGSNLLQILVFYGVSPLIIFPGLLSGGIFKGYKIDPSTTLSHLFYADDAVFIGEWSHSNLKGIMNILRCFSLLSGMSINIQKSHLLGVGIPDNCVAEAAKSIGCLIMKAPFKYLGILVGDNMSSKKAWDETINKMKKRLSRWKLNTLSVGGRLTLLKSVLGSTPIYNMSIFKVPKSVLNYMESLRRNFFNGIQEGDRKIAWVKWSKVLASKKFGGLGVSSFFALNRALLFKWVWRYLSHDNSLWSRIISALHGLNGHVLSAAFNSTWSSIITEVNSLKVKGVDLISHCKIRVGKGTGTSFWKDLWIGDNLLKLSFPRLFALEENKDISVADKMNTSISSSFRRHVRGGVESQQLDQLSLLLDTVILSNMDDRWFWDLNGDGVFQVKDVRSMLDEAFLPKMEVPTRWIKSIPIKVNVFAWKLYLDRLPTRSNLSRRNVSLPSLACPLCDHVLEDSSHLFFGCSVAKDIQKLICRWRNLDVHPYESYEDWLSWFKSIRLGSKTKEVLEGVFYVSWWSLWNFRNQFLFASPILRKDAIFDNIVLRSFYWCVARFDEAYNARLEDMLEEGTRKSKDIKIGKGGTYNGRLEPKELSREDKESLDTYKVYSRTVNESPNGLEKVPAVAADLPPPPPITTTMLPPPLTKKKEQLNKHTDKLILRIKPTKPTSTPTPPTSSVPPRTYKDTYYINVGETKDLLNKVSESLAKQTKKYFSETVYDYLSHNKQQQQRWKS
ncbi:RNA-directed DNA polymerase, eukaryota [Tanacetum coccineum]